MLTFFILEGLDGVKKMSKSLNNYIGLKEKPEMMFGKIMSISDELMWKYYDLLSFKPNKDINSYKAEVKKGANPMEFKILLGEEIVERFHSKKAAQDTKEEFKNRFSKKKAPSKIKKVSIKIIHHVACIIYYGNTMRKLKYQSGLSKFKIFSAYLKWS